MTRENMMDLAKYLWDRDEEEAIELANIIFSIRDGDFEELGDE